MTVEIRRGTARFVERAEGRVTHHSFSFGEQYDAERLGFGPMVCHDDHLLGAGRGFDTHHHSGLDIVTWVATGALVHTDSASGESLRVEPGSLAVLRSGSGVEHSEVAADDAGPTRFVQVWLRADDTDDPDHLDAAPSYDVRAGGSVQLGSARLEVVRLGDGETRTLPSAPLAHAFVASGALTRSSLAEPLVAGDAFLVTEARELTVTAGVPTELLVWTFG